MPISVCTRGKSCVKQQVFIIIIVEFPEESNKVDFIGFTAVVKGRHSDLRTKR